MPNTPGLGKTASVSSDATKQTSSMNSAKSQRPPLVFPDLPAPYAAPPRTRVRPPMSLVKPASNDNTPFARLFNSSSGRCLTHVLTLFCFCFASFGLMEWKSPERRLNGTDFPLLFAALLFVLLLYACMPVMAVTAGMQPLETGWKPYFVLYRCSFLLAIPSLICLGLGYGESNGFGTSAGSAVNVADLEPGTLKYFEATNGFVALNLSKGVLEAATPHEHGRGQALRISRFHDAELKNNYEPFNDEVEPTVPPQTLSTTVVAPIFANWAVCVSRYQVSPQCLRDNPVVAWAVARPSSMCSQMRMVACNETKPMLDPVYRCSSDSPQSGRDIVLPISGVCGRVVEAPPPGTRDELALLLIDQRWPPEALPTNESLAWIDVQPNECIAQPDVCLLGWNIVGLIGVFFSVLTIGCIIIPAVVDCIVDKRIRDAQKFFSKSHRQHKGVVC